MVDMVRFRHPKHGYVKNDANGSMVYERWLPSPLIWTWLEASGLGAKRCARAYELSNSLAWVAKGCPLFAGYAGKTPSESERIIKALAKEHEKWCSERGWWRHDNDSAWNLTQRKVVEASFGAKREIVKVDWAGIPMPVWTKHKGGAMGFNPVEAQAFKDEMSSALELAQAMPLARAEAKALGYAMGLECEPARLEKLLAQYAGVVEESYEDTNDAARRKAFVLYVDQGVKKGFALPVKGNSWRQSFADGTAGALMFEDPDAAKDYALEMFSGARTVKLVEVDIAICSYETIEGYKSPVDELEAAVCLRESEVLRGEIEAASLSRIENEASAARGGRSASSRL